MGHKRVCLNCYRTENIMAYIYSDHTETTKCPLCSSEMVYVNHSFRPPKKTDLKRWAVVKFLISKGFIFQHIYQEGKSDYHKELFDNYIPYPKTMKEAQEFVIKYQNQSIKN